MSQNGSRILQKCISKTSKNILHLILLEIGNKISDMLMDPYANYFCPKFFSDLLQSDRLLFLNFIKPKIVLIAKNKIGTYPLQFIIENLQTEEEYQIVIESIENHILELCLVKYFLKHF
jgi:hypothetical protein